MIKYRNQSILLIIFLSLVTGVELSAQDTIVKKEVEIPQKNTYLLGFLPSRSANIYGVSIGLIGSEVFCDIPFTRKSHGLNVQLFGQGIFSLLNPKAFSFETNFSSDSSFMVKKYDSTTIKTKHNGIIVSSFGTFTDEINGVSISFISSIGYMLNGISVNLIANKYTQLNGFSIGLINNSFHTNGIQLGLINKTNTMNGFQIGLWNINSKRKLPFINWQFQKKSSQRKQ